MYIEVTFKTGKSLRRSEGLRETVPQNINIAVHSVAYYDRPESYSGRT